MAKIYKQPSIVSGLSIDDILSMSTNEVSKLNLSDLRKVVGRLVSAGNKRLRRLESKGVSTPATEFIKRSGGPLTTKGKNVNELRAEFRRAKTFLRAKSGSLKRITKRTKNVTKALQKAGVKSITHENSDRLFKLYDRIKELDPGVQSKSLKYKVMDEIGEMLDGAQDTDVVNMIMDTLTDLYESLIFDEQEMNGFYDI